MARLPTPGQDKDTWGTILNNYLSVAHTPGGTIKSGSIAESHLDPQVQTKLNSGGVSGVSSVNTRTGAVTLSKSDVGLGNVDNTADASKSFTASQVSDSSVTGRALVTAATTTAARTALGLATVASSGSYTDLTNQPTIPAQFAPVAGANISLGGTYPNITISASGGAGGGATDITVSRTSTQVTVESSSGLDGVIATADASNAGVLTAADKTKLDGIATGAQVNTVSSVASKTGVVTLVKGDVGLGNVDNTADSTKSFSGSQITSGTVPIAQIPTGTSSTTVALGNHTHSGFESTLTAGTTSQYYRGDKSWQTLDKTAVGLSNVDNTSDTTKNAASVTLTNKTISGSSNTLSNIPESAVTNLTTDLAAKLSKTNTISANGGTQGYLLNITQTYTDNGAGLEPIMFEGWRGSARRAFWLNENGSPRGASVNDEPGLKIFGPAANLSYAGLVVQFLKAYNSQTHLWGINTAGNPVVGSALTIGANVVVLNLADSVPTGLPAGTVIVRKPT